MRWGGGEVGRNAMNRRFQSIFGPRANGRGFVWGVFVYARTALAQAGRRSAVEV